MSSIKIPKLASNGFWAFAGQIGSTIAGLAYFGFLARMLTRDEMGIYFLLMSITMFFSIIGSFGIPESLVRILAQHIGADKKQEARAAGNTGILVVLQISTAVACLAVLLASNETIATTFKLNNYDFSLIAFGVWIATLSIQSVICEYFRGLHDIKRATLFNNFGKNAWSLATAIICWLYATDFNLNIAIISAAAALTINNTIGLIQLRKSTKLLGKKSHFNLSEILKIAVPLCANTLLIFSLTRFGVWALGVFAPPAQIALYGAALQFVALLALPLMVVNAVVPPTIASQYHNNTSHSPLQKTLRTVTTLAAVPASFAMVVTVLYGSHLLGFVYGDDYRASYSILVVLAFGQVTNVLVGPSGTLLKMTGNQGLLLKINFCFGLFSAAFTVFAALQYGALGVAVVAGSTMTIQNVVTLLIAARKTNINCASYCRPVDLFSIFNEAKRYFQPKKHTREHDGYN